MAAKKAITFSTEDVDGDGSRDFSLKVGDKTFFTLYDAKNLILKIAGTAGGGIIALLVGINIL